MRMTVARIGSRESALHRLERFIAAVKHYTGKDPARVSLFAEDYDALTPEDLAEFGVKIERGPSVAECS